MKKRYAIVLGALLLAGGLFVAPSAAHAQAAWDSPMFETPRRMPGVGLFLTQPAYGGLGAMITWSPTGGPGGWGLRGGVANDERGSGLTVFGGLDASHIFVTADQSFPLDVGWAAGAGLGAGEDGVLVSIPAELTFGRELDTSSGVDFTPYVAPRVTLDLASTRSGHPAPGDGSRLGLSVDLGVDLNVHESWKLRFGATLGDHNAVAAGIVF